MIFVLEVPDQAEPSAWFAFDLDDLLRCDDYDNWAWVNGSKACENDRWKEMIGLLRQG